MGLKKKIVAQSGARENQIPQPSPFSRPQPHAEPIQDPPVVQEPSRPMAPPLDAEDLARKLEARLAPKIEDAVSKVFEQQLYVELDRRFKSIQERMGEFDQIGQKEGLQTVLERLSKLEEMQRKLLERPPNIQTVRVCAGCGLAIPQGRQTCPDCAPSSEPPIKPAYTQQRSRQEARGEPGYDQPREPGKAQREPARKKDDFPSESDYDIEEERATKGGAEPSDDEFEITQRPPGSKQRLNINGYGSKSDDEYYQDAQYRDNNAPGEESNDPADWDRGYQSPIRDRDANYTGRGQGYERGSSPDYGNERGPVTDYGYDPRPRQNQPQRSTYGGSQPQYQQAAPPPPPASPAHPICPGCSSSMEFISAYGAWYCRGCKGYLDPSNGQLAKVDGTASQANTEEQPIPVQEMPTKKYQDSEKTLGDFHAYIEIDPEKEGKPEGGQEENGKKKGFWPFKKK